MPGNEEFIFCNVKDHEDFVELNMTFSQLKQQNKELIKMLEKCHYFIKASCRTCNLSREIEDFLNILLKDKA